MRRVFNSPKHKRHSARRARKEMMQRATRKSRLFRRAQNLPPRPPKPLSLTKRAARRITSIPAPRNFSVIDNPNEVLRYFASINDTLRTAPRVSVDLSNVTNLTPDAIALLVASVNDVSFTRRKQVIGNGPTDTVARRMFDESGFFDHVESTSLRPNKGSHLLLHKVTHNRVENIEAMNAGKLTTAHLYGDRRRIPALYEVLIECMANTNNHAAAGKRGRYDWWLFVYNDPAAPRTVLTFLDLGVGIFRSLPVRNFVRTVLKAARLTSNFELIPKLVAGEISSRTGKRERGKGIPRIYQHASARRFSRAVLISNDVYVDLVTLKGQTLKTDLHGTLYSFELSALPMAGPR